MSDFLYGNDTSHGGNHHFEFNDLLQNNLGVRLSQKKASEFTHKRFSLSAELTAINSVVPDFFLRFSKKRKKNWIRHVNRIHSIVNKYKIQKYLFV